MWTKVFGKTSILRGLWFDMVWTGWSSIFSKHPFQKVALILFILFFKIILEENNSKCSKELNQFCPPNSSNDLCLLFCLYPSSMGPLQPANNSLWPTVMYEDRPPCIIMPIYGYVGRPLPATCLFLFLCTYIGSFTNYTCNNIHTFPEDYTVFYNKIYA